MNTDAQWSKRLSGIIAIQPYGYAGATNTFVVHPQNAGSTTFDIYTTTNPYGASTDTITTTSGVFTYQDVTEIATNTQPFGLTSFSSYPDFHGSVYPSYPNGEPWDLFDGWIRQMTLSAAGYVASFGSGEFIKLEDVNNFVSSSETNWNNEKTSSSSTSFLFSAQGGNSYSFQLPSATYEGYSEIANWNGGNPSYTLTTFTIEETTSTWEDSGSFSATESYSASWFTEAPLDFPSPIGCGVGVVKVYCESIWPSFQIFDVNGEYAGFMNPQYETSLIHPNIAAPVSYPTYSLINNSNKGSVVNWFLQTTYTDGTWNEYDENGEPVLPPPMVIPIPSSNAFYSDTIQSSDNDHQYPFNYYTVRVVHIAPIYTFLGGEYSQIDPQSYNIRYYTESGTGYTTSSFNSNYHLSYPLQSSSVPNDPAYKGGIYGNAILPGGQNYTLNFVEKGFYKLSFISGGSSSEYSYSSKAIYSSLGTSNTTGYRPLDEGYDTYIYTTGINPDGRLATYITSATWKRNNVASETYLGTTTYIYDPFADYTQTITSSSSTSWTYAVNTAEDYTSSSSASSSWEYLEADTMRIESAGTPSIVISVPENDLLLISATPFFHNTATYDVLGGAPTPPVYIFNSYWPN